MPSIPPPKPSTQFQMVTAGERCTAHALPETVARHHEHAAGPKQCCSAVVQAVAAPVGAVVVGGAALRRAAGLQALREELPRRGRQRRGGHAPGGARRVGPPAATSTERLEVLDDEHTCSASGWSDRPAAAALRSWSRTWWTCRRATPGRTRACSSTPSSSATSSPWRAPPKPFTGATSPPRRRRARDHLLFPGLSLVSVFFIFLLSGNQQLAGLPLQLAADNLKLVMDKRQVGFRTSKPPLAKSQKTGGEIEGKGAATSYRRRGRKWMITSRESTSLITFREDKPPRDCKYIIPNSSFWCRVKGISTTLFDAAVVTPVGGNAVGVKGCYEDADEALGAERLGGNDGGVTGSNTTEEEEGCGSAKGPAKTIAFMRWCL
ncbi:hypothetical protein C4D60_Mb03t09590 [Musa balbisiana]|uniref:Uncharacterized protein n=1 Tax=Musa balbisiana TaxID=52838 RepID=A0A4S8J8R0_MUSBA|nr:hypothetical protein C4D60_Mb03t09590 [Musa balbisiana]